MISIDGKYIFSGSDDKKIKFWRHNFKLVPCQGRELEIRGKSPLDDNQVKQIQNVLTTNQKIVRDYIDLLKGNLIIDLYTPEKDEILFGLFGRLTRLFWLLFGDVQLWSRDIGNIILRCMTETAITFAYLSKKGNSEEFQKFIEYGEGQQKLLMLQLQDNYPEDSSPDGLDSVNISEQLGGFQAELLDIELGHWTKKDTRKLAQEVGFEKFYRLVFNPTSADVHGTWMSLSNSNLDFCVESLHRYHRLPSYSEPPFFLEIFIAAQQIYIQCQEIGVDILSYPKPQCNMESLTLEDFSNTEDSSEKGKTNSVK